MAIYAETTRVPVAKTRSEIETILRKAGASRIVTMDEEIEMLVAFTLELRIIKISVAVDPKTSDQMRRARWRALLLILKAKLEAVAQKITTVEQEFLPHVVLPDGGTVYQHVKASVALAYEKGEMPPLLPDYTKGADRG